MRRLLYFLHISSLLCRTTVCSLAIGGILLCLLLADILHFCPVSSVATFKYKIGIKKDFGRLAKVLCFCILLSIFDFKLLRLPIRFQKWSPSGCSIPTA